MSGEQVVTIVQTDVPNPTPAGIRAEVVDVALMVTTAQWIPVDSGYEAAVVGSLVAEGRRFEKPMRFDAEEDRTFPDFWLKDSGDPLPMEVWGMNEPEYLARKAQKVAYYDERYGGGTWWQWDAAAGGPIPRSLLFNERPSNAPSSFASRDHKSAGYWPCHAACSRSPRRARQATPFDYFLAPGRHPFVTGRRDRHSVVAALCSSQRHTPCSIKYQARRCRPTGAGRQRSMHVFKSNQCERHQRQALYLERH